MSSTVESSSGAGTEHRSFWTGRSGLVVAAFLLGLAIFLTYGTLTMEVPPNVSSPGPQFFPTIVTVLTYLLAVLLAVQVIRHPSVPQEETAAEETDGAAEEEGAGEGAEASGEETPASAGGAGERPAVERYRTHTDWRTVGIVVASFVAFTVLLVPVGWLISGALLFWGVTYALHGKRPLFDASVALVVSSVIQLAFSAGLGLNLPAGILGGVF
ncbi:tripartite tricarboxylate transporter TctB family protein [Actinoalloteichus sp. AHMU CJ021]|uniref:Tricarboxylic transport membrane protein n=1 Tax=Actinoalloteichus caeruleus DSM 43889 TaxID=1120930 RepID=A0ABT1JF86_ACTCY|nr:MULTISPECIES: tripartite tricarboxylate transporter TctB family protein [Actinoalloteichus]AUS77339.1 tripartite tricarboxylate transporter TctB family protein [Actinoalloteichus sp. AHMU CJ021]MCP2331157.1 putative tricarboxylic transport membrane protein [Actinoalloteichus caeruleus DSM 43889]